MSNDPPGPPEGLQERAHRFADLACLAYFGVDHVSRREDAARILAESPEITRVSCHAAAGRLRRGGPERAPVRRWRCRRRPPAVPATGRPCSTSATAGSRRIPPSATPWPPSRVLLAAGADGNTFLVSDKLGGWRWSGLTGAMGEGEEGLLQQPPHARARELAEILLGRRRRSERLAGPLQHHVHAGRPVAGAAAGARADGGGRGRPRRGPADPDPRLPAIPGGQDGPAGDGCRCCSTTAPNVAAADIYNGRSNYVNALLHGHPEIAALLVERGAEALELSLEDRFTAAVTSGDDGGARQLLEEAPGLIEDPALLMEAANNAAATRLLLELGADPNAPAGNGRVPLHEAAWADNAEVVRLLLANGARCEIRENDHNATPVGFANHAGNFELRDLLLDHSRNVFDLAAFGRTRQLADLLKSEPALAKTRGAHGHTPVHAVAGGAPRRTGPRPAPRPRRRDRRPRRRRRHAPLVGPQARRRGGRGAPAGSRRPGVSLHISGRHAGRPGESTWPSAT